MWQAGIMYALMNSRAATATVVIKYTSVAVTMTAGISVFGLVKLDVWPWGGLSAGVVFASMEDNDM